MDAQRLLDGLDASQRAAIVEQRSPLAIIASAGSGKTSVLTRRIAYRIATGTASARHVLALTFTRQAAGELHRRLQRLDLREPIEAGTFHAVALRLMRDRALSQNRPPPAVANDRIRIVRDVLGELHLRLDPFAATADIDWARARRVGPADIAAASRQAGRRMAIPAERYSTVLDLYTKHKRRRGVVDFDDLLEFSLQAMSDPTFAEAVAWRFRHFFVDEAQDLNPLQFSVLEAWRGQRPDLCLVGDPRQAIYAWNGSEPKLLAEVERTFPGIVTVDLRTNYRCSPQIVRAGSAVLSAAGVADETTAGSSDGPAVAVRVCADEHDEATTVARWTADAARQHGANGVAVIARTNEQLGVIVEALATAGLACRRDGASSPLDRIVAEAARQRSRAELVTWCQERLADDNPLVRRVAEAVDRYLAVPTGESLRAWIDEHRPFEDLDAGTDPAITATTMHAAKGREWDAVAVVGMVDGLCPHSSARSADQRAEEARLVYVGITRARRDLLLTAFETRGGATAAESPWLGAIRDSTAIDRPARRPPAPPRTTIPSTRQALVAWRRQIARRVLIDDVEVCSDDVLRRIERAKPQHVADLAAMMGITHSAASSLPPLPWPSELGSSVDPAPR